VDNVVSPLSPVELRRCLECYNLYPHKGLGQNFLVDENIRRKILDAAELTLDDFVLEVGPGAGALTEPMLEVCKGVIAVEIDRGLVRLLQDKLGHNPRLHLLEGDARSMDLAEICQRLGRNNRIKVVANLPYYLTSPLTIRLLQDGHLVFERLLLMVQKEVARRMVAVPGTKEYGLLSVVVSFFTRPRLLFTVPATVFFPQPEVESALVMLKPEPSLIPPVDKEIFLRVVRAAFARRRKHILNNLIAGFSLSREEAITILEKSSISPHRRGETLSVQEFANLAEEVYNTVRKNNQQNSKG